MGFLWAWVPHRKERKELEKAIKPANAQERKALGQFGRTASNLILHETGLVKTEHSLDKLKGKILDAAKPAAKNGVQVRVHFSQDVPPGLELDGNLFPELWALILISGMKTYDRKDMLLQVDYNKHSRKLTLEMPCMVQPKVPGNPLVRSAVSTLSGRMELTPLNNTKLTLHAKKA
ncbi:MAG: hypothetical protein NTX79_06020 [Candidatus Micrarchaeota archaeon]|nr:hypothetical protein [Candidatus Micrarchaeota archaeon]